MPLTNINRQKVSQVALCIAKAQWTLAIWIDQSLIPAAAELSNQRNAALSRGRAAKYAHPLGILGRPRNDCIVDISLDQTGLASSF